VIFIREFTEKERNRIRNQLIERGRECFSKFGIKKTSIEELTKAAGIAKGSFYSFFATTPRGRHTIRVCMGTACYVRGGVSVVEALEKQLGIQAGGTTADGAFTFEIARCIGSCSLAPAMIIDDTVYPEVKPADLPGILEPWYHD
jgi:NADH:ubiquinone oxidoreductase subunit E